MNSREYILAELRRERAARDAERKARAERNLAIAIAIVVGVALLIVCTVQLLAPTTDAEAVPLYDIAIGEENTNVTTEAPVSDLISLGEFRITGYCPTCPDCCGKWASDPHTASGTVATVGRTVAVDTDIIPFGMVLIIDGHEYIAEDTGSGVKDKHIDIACATHEECYAITGTKEVWTR